MTLPDPQLDPAFYDHLIAKRFLAWVVDLAITLALMLVVIVGTLFLAAFIFPLIWAAIAIAYRWVMLTRYGQTVGMMVASIKLRHLDGRRADSNTCLVHSVIYAFTMMFVVTQIGSVALMLTTPFKQGLNDWILGTTLINRFNEV